MKIHILAKQFEAIEGQDKITLLNSNWQAQRATGKTVVESLLWAYQLTLTELSNQGLTHSTSGH
jgi:hypothetical protein